MSDIQDIMTCPCGCMPGIWQYHDDSEWRAGCDGPTGGPGVCKFNILEVAETRNAVILKWNDSVRNTLQSNRPSDWDKDLELPWDNPTFVEGYSKGTSDGLNQAIDVLNQDAEQPDPSKEEPVTIQEQILAFIAWQNNSNIHPFTCGNDSNHTPLLPYVDLDKKVSLFCLQCDYKQTFGPQHSSYVLDAMRNGLHDIKLFPGQE